MPNLPLNLASAYCTHFWNSPSWINAHILDAKNMCFISHCCVVRENGGLEGSAAGSGSELQMSLWGSNMTPYHSCLPTPGGQWLKAWVAWTFNSFLASRSLSELMVLNMHLSESPFVSLGRSLRGAPTSFSFPCSPGFHH
jgi:hypothetical protein